MKKIKIILSIVAVIILFSCDRPAENNSFNGIENYEKEKEAIISVINNETKAAFQRDYKSWKEKWVHDSNISKSYLNFVDGTYSETLGWDDINKFVKTYIEENPEPDILPKLVDDVELRLYGNGAWIVFEQLDPKVGLKRETRLMEKEDGVWKIAGMQTSIYGFEK